MFVDLKLDRYKTFNVRYFLFYTLTDGTVMPVILTGWAIKGAVIFSIDDELLDIPLTATMVNKGKTGLFDITMSEASRDLIFSTFNKKHALNYEVRANFFNGQGCILSHGNLLLKRTRMISS